MHSSTYEGSTPSQPINPYTLVTHTYNKMLWFFSKAPGQGWPAVGRVPGQVGRWAASSAAPNLTLQSSSCNVQCSMVPPTPLVCFFLHLLSCCKFNLEFTAALVIQFHLRFSILTYVDWLYIFNWICIDGLFVKFLSNCHFYI